MAGELPKFAIRDAVGSLQEYVKTYTDSGYNGYWTLYSRETFLEDMLFGIAIALGYEKHGPGLDAFKDELRERLNARAPTAPESA